MKRSAIVLALTAAAAVCFSSGQAFAQAPIVINEIDYNQPGTDTAEYIELKNVSSLAIDLDTYSIELVNGTGGGAVVYETIDLPAVMLAAGDYYVVCANPSTANCDLDVAPNTDLVQNGAPDAVGLRNGMTLVDAVSYEGDTGAPYVEGSGVGLNDSGANANQGISRFPDGTDTDSNNADWSLRCDTPGQANIMASAMCLTPVAVESKPWTQVKRLYQ